MKNSSAPKKRLAFFASGKGTNMENILRWIRAGKLRAEPVLMVTDNPAAPALEKAKKFKVDTLALIPKEFPSKEAYEAEILRKLEASRADYLVLAGYMRIVGPTLLRAYASRIVNIHPALLPAFKGACAIKDAYEYGVQVTGVTVHFVDEQVDHGPIILQKAVPVRPGETFAALEKKIHKAEYETYPAALKLLVSGRLRLEGRCVRIGK